MTNKSFLPEDYQLTGHSQGFLVLKPLSEAVKDVVADDVVSVGEEIGAAFHEIVAFSERARSTLLPYQDCFPACLFSHLCQFSIETLMMVVPFWLLLAFRLICFRDISAKII